MFCNNCGYRLHEAAEFCPSCGKKIRIRPRAVEEPGQEIRYETEPEYEDREYVRPSGKSHAKPAAAGTGISKALMIVIPALIVVIGTTIGLLIIKPWKGKDSAEKKAATTHEETSAENTFDKSSGETGADSASSTERSNDESDMVEAKAETVPNSEVTPEEMYAKVSDMFADFYVYDGDTYGSFDAYDGNSDNFFIIYGDIGDKYNQIVSFEDNIITLNGDGFASQVKMTTPWMVELVLRDGSTSKWLAGTIPSINEAMSGGQYPEYIFPNSDSEIIDIHSNVMTYQVCRLAKNEIYARHGRKFKDEELQAYFNNRSWYNGTIEPEDFKDDMLNEVERQNANEFKFWEDCLVESGQN